jgi:hypothetical protein
MRYRFFDEGHRVGPPGNWIPVEVGQYRKTHNDGPYSIIYVKTDTHWCYPGEPEEHPYEYDGCGMWGFPIVLTEEEKARLI